jgi:hypothetical protein
MTPYTPVATHHDTISTPDSNDTVDISDIVLCLTELADNIKRLEDATFITPGTYVVRLARDGTPENSSFGSGASWSFMGYTGIWVQGSNVYNKAMFWELELPVGTLVSGLSVTCFGSQSGGAHGSTLPATKPTLSLLEYDSAGSLTSAVIGPTTDPSGSAAVYDAGHSIDAIPGSPIEIAPLCRYMVYLTGESGANSLPTEFSVSAVTLSVELP